MANQALTPDRGLVVDLDLSLLLPPGMKVEIGKLFRFTLILACALWFANSAHAGSRATPAVKKPSRSTKAAVRDGTNQGRRKSSKSSGNGTTKLNKVVAAKRAEHSRAGAGARKPAAKKPMLPKDTTALNVLGWQMRGTTDGKPMLIYSGAKVTVLEPQYSQGKFSHHATVTLQPGSLVHPSTIFFAVRQGVAEHAFRRQESRSLEHTYLDGVNRAYILREAKKWDRNYDDGR